MSKKSSEFTVIIEAQRSQKEYLKDLIRYREVFFFVAWRDILVRYKQTLLGVSWSIVRPLINMAVFAFIFGKIANLNSDEISYPLFVLAGMIPWQLFANSLADTSTCLLNNAHMISKVYFPRLVFPMSHVVVNSVDFLISLTMMIVLTLIIGPPIQWTFLLLPFFVLLTLMLCLGVGLWLSAISVRYRDFRFIIPFIIQFGMFISPVGYGSFIIPEKWRIFYFLNPMAGIIDGFRLSFFGTYHSDFPIALGLSIAVNTFLLVTGFRFFRKMERVFADII